MNTQKYRMGNLGLLGEADRSMYKNKDTVSKSIIDPTRTHLNYNLCPHKQYTVAQIKYINRTLRGKEIAKNAIAWGSTIITVPKDYEGDKRVFFEMAYEGLKKMYNLKDEDIISAYVHMDESGPGHLHFYFIPVVHKEGKPDKINWDGVMPRSRYKNQHIVLQKYLTEKLQTDVHLLNGETLGFDVQKLSPEEKKISMELAKKQKELESANDDLETVRIFTDEKKATLELLDAKIRKREQELESAQSRFKQNLTEWVEAHNGLQRILRASPRLSESNRDKIEYRMAKAIQRGDKAIEEATDDIASLMRAADEMEFGKREFATMKKAAKENLNIDDLLEDDDFER